MPCHWWLHHEGDVNGKLRASGGGQGRRVDGHTCSCCVLADVVQKNQQTLPFTQLGLAIFGPPPWSLFDLPKCRQPHVINLAHNKHPTTPKHLNTRSPKHPKQPNIQTPQTPERAQAVFLWITCNQPSGTSTLVHPRRPMRTTASQCPVLMNGLRRARKHKGQQNGDLIVRVSNPTFDQKWLEP